MGSESIAHEAEGKISRQNNFSQQNAIQPPLFWFQSRRFSLLVGYNI